MNKLPPFLDPLKVSINRAIAQNCGISVPVNTSVTMAYARLRREAREAKLAKLERHYFNYTKPKYARQQRQKELGTRERKKLFSERLHMAMDMMKAAK